MTTPPTGPQQPYPPQPGQPYPQQPYQQPPKKKKVWPWIVGAIILIIILFFAGCMAFFGGVANEIDKESNRTVEVTYRVTGEGGTASSITFTDADWNTAQDTSVSLPWEKKVSIDGLGKLASLMASNSIDAAPGTAITCEILVDGEVKYTNTATGPGASASCSGDVG